VVRIYPGRDHGLGSAVDLPASAFELPVDLAVADLHSDGRRALLVAAPAT
jgi:hypothetical protein